MRSAQAIDRAKAAGKRRFMHTLPSGGNPPSNAICRELGFELLEQCECEFEFPPGSFLRCNDWRLDLRVSSRASDPQERP